MKKMKLTAILLAVLAAMSMNVYASDTADTAVPAETAAEEAVTEEIAPAAKISFPGMIQLDVTSSISAPAADTSVLFDGQALSGINLTVSEDSRTYTLYASIGVRDYVDLLAVQMNDEDPDEVTTVEVAVYGSNDDETWTQFDVTNPSEENGFYVFDILGCEEKYTFWRIDFTVGMGDGFAITEAALFKQDKGEPEYIYNLGDEIAEGELPELVPVIEETEEPAPAKKPFFGLLPFIMGFRM